MKRILVRITMHLINLPDDLKSCDQIMLEALGANKKVFELLSEVNATWSDQKERNR